MGLADLKKNSTQSKTTYQSPIKLSHQSAEEKHWQVDELVEDFINDANRYALGQNLKTSSLNKEAHEHIAASTLKEALGDSVICNLKQHQDTAVVRVTKGCVPVRKATFTLTESAIAHLATLAEDCDIAKSKLLRFLIEHYFNLTPEQRKQAQSSIIVE